MTYKYKFSEWGSDKCRLAIVSGTEIHSTTWNAPSYFVNL